MSFDLDSILRLGDLDSKLIDVRRRVKMAGVQSAPQKERVDASKTELAKLVDQSKTGNRDVARLEGEAEAKKAQIIKAEVALNSAKTNEEYQVHLRTIDGHKQELSDIETKILEAYDAQEKNVESQKSGDKRLIDLEKDLKAAEGRVKEYEATLNKEIAELDGQRTEAASVLSRDFIKLYERLLEKMGNSAIARVVDEMCQGCFQKVRPNQVSQIRGRKELVTCWTCGRVLYSDSES